MHLPFWPVRCLELDAGWDEEGILSRHYVGKTCNLRGPRGSLLISQAEGCPTGSAQTRIGRKPEYYETAVRKGEAKPTATCVVTANVFTPACAEGKAKKPEGKAPTICLDKNIQQAREGKEGRVRRADSGCQS